MSWSVMADGSKRCSSDEGVGERAEAGGCGAAWNRERAAESLCHAAHEIRAGDAEAFVAGTQARVNFGMTDGEKLEFEREQHEPAVLAAVRVVIAQGAKARFGAFLLFERGVHFRDARGHPLFEQRDENIFLALEIGVESAAGVAGKRGDVFEARGFEAIAREDGFGGGEQALPGGCGASLLPRRATRRFSTDSRSPAA